MQAHTLIKHKRSNLIHADVIYAKIEAIQQILFLRFLCLPDKETYHESCFLPDGFYSKND